MPTESTEVDVIQTPTYVDVIEEKIHTEIVQEQYVVEVYGAVGTRGAKGQTGNTGATGPALPIVFFKKGPAALLVSDGRYRFPFDCTITGVSATTGDDDPPIGADLTFELLIDGAPVHSGVIPDGLEDAPEVVTTIPVNIGEHLQIRITGIGSVEPGSNVSIFIRYEL